MMTIEEHIVMLMKDAKTQEKGIRMMMNEYQKRLYWNIRRLVSNEEIAKDVLQETFIKAFHKFHLFKGDSRLYTWLYRIAYNEILQEWRSSNKLLKVDDAEEDWKSQIYEEGKSGDEIQMLLDKAISQLPEKQRLVFCLRYYDELPYEEIGRVLGMSIATLKTNYHYAKTKIEQYILENSEEF